MTFGASGGVCIGAENILEISRGKHVLNISFDNNSGWIHVLSSFDAGNGLMHFYINDVDEKNGNIADRTIDYTRGDFSIADESLDVSDILKDNPSFKLVIVGSSVTEKDKSYKKKLVEEINNRKLEERVELVGDVPQKSLPEYYNKARAFVNLSETGSLDKAVLEALAMNVPVYTTNEAFLGSAFPVFQNIEEALRSEGNTRDYIVKNHSLERLINRIVNTL